MLANQIMNIRFYIDPETDLPHICDHAIDEQEVEEVLASPGEDRPGREGSRIALGQTSSGRYLRVNLRAGPGARQRLCHHRL